MFSYYNNNESHNQLIYKITNKRDIENVFTILIKYYNNNESHIQVGK